MGDRHIPIIDEDKLDDIITALQALSAPSATNVAVDPTGMHIVTEDDVQGAISELDAKAYEINSSLTQKASKTWTQLANEKVTANTSKNISVDIRNYNEFIFVFGTNTSSNQLNYARAYTLPISIAIDRYISDTYYGDSTYRYSFAVALSNLTESQFTLRISEVSIGSPYQTNGLRFMLFAR